MCNQPMTKLTRADDSGRIEAECLDCGIAYRGNIPYAWAGQHECGYSRPWETPYEFPTTRFATAAA